jgi:hypothetical protein
MNRISFFTSFGLVFIFIGLISLSPLIPVSRAIAEQNQTGSMAMDNKWTVKNVGPWVNPNKHQHDAVSVGEGRIIGQDEEVMNDMVVIGANLTIHGTVNGDAVCIGGDLSVGPQAVIKGDLVNIGGKLSVDTTAKIYGDRVNLAGFPFGFLKALKGAGIEQKKGVDQFGTHKFSKTMGFAAKLVRFVLDCVYLLLILFLAFLLTVFMPRHFNNIEEYLSNEFPRCTLLGIACMVGVPVILLLFIITLIGILAIPLLFVALVVSSLTGYIVISRILARRLFPEKHIMFQILAGLLLLHSPLLIGDLILLQNGDLYIIIGHVLRVVGKIVYYGFNFIGLGAVIYSHWGTRGLILENGNEPNEFSGPSGNGDAATA